MPPQNIDNNAVGKRIEEIIAQKRVKSRRSFAISVNADPSFFDKIVKGQAPLTSKIAKSIASEYGVNEEWIWNGEGEKWSKGGLAQAEPTPMHILSVLAQAFKDQAKAFADQAEIMRSIESKMAQETTQANMETNLKAVRKDVTTLVERQSLAVEEMRDHFDQLGIQRKNASKDVRKKANQSDGNG